MITACTGGLQLQESLNSTSVSLTNEKVVNMLEGYQQSNLCNENRKQLKEVMDTLVDREHRKEEGKVKRAAYATNYLWQVRHNLVCIYKTKT